MEFNLDRKYQHFVTFTVISLEFFETIVPAAHPSDEVHITLGANTLRIKPNFINKRDEVKIIDFESEDKSAQEKTGAGEKRLSMAERWKLIEQANSEAAMVVKSKSSQSSVESKVEDYTPPKPFGTKKWEIFCSTNKICEQFTYNIIDYHLLRCGNVIAKGTQWLVGNFVEELKQPIFGYFETIIDQELLEPDCKAPVATARMHIKVERTDPNFQNQFSAHFGLKTLNSVEIAKAFRQF